MMTRRSLLRQITGLAAFLVLLVGCAVSPEDPPQPGHEPTSTSVLATATPDPCTGWTCTVQGIVYVGAASSGNESAGTLVELKQVSFCSPTRGQHQTRTDDSGRFEFEVFIHDTDRFWIQIDQNGYAPVRRAVGGFDCLYCACPPIEIVLEPLEAPTPAP